MEILTKILIVISDLGYFCVSIALISGACEWVFKNYFKKNNKENNEITQKIYEIHFQFNDNGLWYDGFIESSFKIKDNKFNVDELDQVKKYIINYSQEELSKKADYNLNIHYSRVRFLSMIEINQFRNNQTDNIDKTTAISSTTLQ